MRRQEEEGGGGRGGTSNTGRSQVEPADCTTTLVATSGSSLSESASIFLLLSRNSLAVATLAVNASARRKGSGRGRDMPPPSRAAPWSPGLLTVLPRVWHCPTPGSCHRQHFSTARSLPPRNSLPLARFCNRCAGLRLLACSLRHDEYRSASCMRREHGASIRLALYALQHPY